MVVGIQTRTLSNDFQKNEIKYPLKFHEKQRNYLFYLFFLPPAVKTNTINKKY